MDKIEQIKEICKKYMLDADYCDDISAYSGDNINDAYTIGEEYGYSGLAKEIMAIINQQ